MATLCLSSGVPMLTAGDERGRTQGGNNNAYGQDNETSWIDWRPDDAWLDVYEITKTALRLRRDHPALRQRHWFEGRPTIKGGLKDLVWVHPDGREMTARRLERRRRCRTVGMFAHGDPLRSPGPRGEQMRDTVLHDLAQRRRRRRRGGAAGQPVGPPRARWCCRPCPTHPGRAPRSRGRRPASRPARCWCCERSRHELARASRSVKHPSADLLIVQLLGILIYPFLSDQPLGRAVFSTFALLVLALAVFAVRMTPALSWVSAGLGLPVVVLTVWEAVSPGVESVRAVVVGVPRGVLLLHRLRAAAVHVRRPRRHHRRALRDRRDVHRGRLGVRLRLPRRRGGPARLVHGRRRPAGGRRRGSRCSTSR